MNFKWIKYHFIVFILQGIFDYLNNFYFNIPSGKTASYTVFFVIQHMAFIGHFYLNFFLVSVLRSKKLVLLIPFQIVIMILSCYVISIIPVIFNKLQGREYVFSIVYFYTMYSVFHFTMLSLGFKFLQDWMSTENEKIELIEAGHQAELTFLRAQINPHFLLNTLNSIYALAIKKSLGIYEALKELSSLFNYISNISNSSKANLSEEIEYLENFIKLSQRRVGKNLDVKIYKKLDNNYFLEPLLLITFIENAFKHGISMKNKSYIFISIEVIEGVLTYKV